MLKYSSALMSDFVATSKEDPERLYTDQSRQNHPQAQLSEHPVRILAYPAIYPANLRDTSPHSRENFKSRHFSCHNGRIEKRKRTTMRPEATVKESLTVQTAIAPKPERTWHLTHIDPTHQRYEDFDTKRRAEEARQADAEDLQAIEDLEKDLKRKGGKA